MCGSITGVLRACRSTQFFVATFPRMWQDKATKYPIRTRCSQGDLQVSRMVHLADGRAHRRGWSRHELALFHDAASLLPETVETDRGVTDEGDPWLVFCDADSGEVLAHFARIGGQHIACVFEGALTGRVLADLATRFLDRPPDKQPASITPLEPHRVSTPATAPNH